VKLRQLLANKKYIHLIREGKKTVEGRVAKPPASNCQIGDRLRLYHFRDRFDDVVCDITDIKKFSSFREMLEETGVQECIPGAKDLEEAVNLYNSFPGYAQQAAKLGVIALYLRVNDEARQEYASRRAV
jgi:ASC-1-like (ASCH) protein